MTTMPDCPRLWLSAPSASPEEAAAIIAAVERFRRASAPNQAAADAEADNWARAAILEGVQREDAQLVGWAPISARD